MFLDYHSKSDNRKGVALLAKQAETAKLSASDQDILTALGTRELYGLQLLKEINIGRAIKLNEGSLYPALTKLKDKGLVSWHWGNDSSPGGRRKYFQATQLGLDSLQEVEKYREELKRRANGR